MEPSTGTNLVAVLVCASHLQRQAIQGSVVSLLCDDGQRYQHTCFDTQWRPQQGLHCDAEAVAVDRWLVQGQWPDELRAACRLAGTLAV